MCPTTPTRVFQDAVLAQQRAQAEFDSAEPMHRAKDKTALAKATLVVAKAASRLHAALEDGQDPSPYPGAPRNPHRPIKQPVSVRVTTAAEDDVLYQILKGDFRMISKQRGSTEIHKTPTSTDNAAQAVLNASQAILLVASC